MTGSGMERWGKIVEELDAAGLSRLAAYVHDETTTAHAAPMSIPIIGETGSGKSALVSRIFGADTTASFPQDVLESTARPVEVKYAPTGYRAVVHTDEWEECSDDDARWDALVRGKETLPDGSRLEVGLPYEALETWNVSIVDTPGMNTSTPELEGRAWATAATAPVVIMAIPAASAGRRTDLDYLKSLGENSSSVVIALTKVDQAPSGSADRIIDDFRNRLEEHGIAPLDILATSATLGNDEQGGIATLRQVLSEVTGGRRDHLVDHHVGGRVVAKLRNELSSLKLKQAALESEALTVQVRGTGEEGDIVEAGADREADLRGAVGTLKDRCERLRLESFNRMYEIGEETLQTVTEEMDALQTRHEVQRFADGSIRHYVLRWRTGCIAIAEDRLGALDQAGAEVAKEVATQHFEQTGISTDWLQELPEGTVTHRSDGDSTNADDLHRSREDLLHQIDELKAHAPTPEALEDIERALADTQAERDELIYEPQMDEVRLDQGKGQLREAGRILGKLADIALILVPIPTGGKAGGVLKNLPGGKKLVSGIKKYNDLIVKRDKWLRGAVESVIHLPKPLQTRLPTPPSGKVSAQVALGWVKKVADNLSLETWGERLGGAVGGWINPDKVIEVENEEVRQAFLKRRKPYDDAVFNLEHERERIRLQQDHIERRLREKRDELKRVDHQTASLEQQREELERQRQALDAEEQASTAKAALMDQLGYQLLTHNRDTLFADIRQAVSAGFDSANEALEGHLKERVNAIKSEVQAALKEARSKREQGETAVKEALNKNQTMRSALESALKQLEAL